MADDGDPTDPNDPEWGNAVADVPCLYLCSYQLDSADQPTDPTYLGLVGNTEDGDPFIDVDNAVGMFYNAKPHGVLLDIELYTPTNQEFQDLQNDPLFQLWFTINP